MVVDAGGIVYGDDLWLSPTTKRLLQILPLLQRQPLPRIARDMAGVLMEGTCSTGSSSRSHAIRSASVCSTTTRRHRRQGGQLPPSCGCAASRVRRTCGVIADRCFPPHQRGCPWTRWLRFGFGLGRRARGRGGEGNLGEQTKVMARRKLKGRDWSETALIGA